MAKAKIKFTGIIKRYGTKTGGEELLIGKVKSNAAEQLRDLAIPKEKDKEKIQGTIEIIQQQLPGTE